LVTPIGLGIDRRPMFHVERRGIGGRPQNLSHCGRALSLRSRTFSRCRGFTWNNQGDGPHGI